MFMRMRNATLTLLKSTDRPAWPSDLNSGLVGVGALALALAIGNASHDSVAGLGLLAGKKSK